MKNLFIKQKVFKITDHYPVLDESGNAVYHVDQDFQLLGLSVVISDQEGNPVCKVDRKILSFLPVFYLSFHTGEEIVMKSRFTFLRQKIDIEPYELGIYIEGNIIDHKFAVYKGGRIIGRIDRELLVWGDTYHLEIIEEEYELLFVGMVVAIDHIIDARQSSGN